jgi:hypothetical protein
MATSLNSVQRSKLSLETRKRFVAEMEGALTLLGSTVQERLTRLIDEPAPTREMQVRREVWADYQLKRTEWLGACAAQWQAALKPAGAKPTQVDPGGLELVGAEEMDRKIIASKMSMAVSEKVTSELDDLTVRMRHLDATDDLDARDILKPDVLILHAVDQWSHVGLSHAIWPQISEVVQRLLTEQLKTAYTNANAFLVRYGVLPTIELKDRVKRVPASAARSGPPSRSATGPAPLGPPSGPGAMPTDQNPPRSGGFFGGRLGWGKDNDGAAPSDRGQMSAGRSSSGYGGAHEETRMMTSTTPLARARSRALGVVGHLKRLLVGEAGANFEATAYQPPSPALAAAMAPRPDRASEYSGGATIIADYTPAGVARVAVQLRQQTNELKVKAETKTEKATIEIVALMFQSILQEDRIPPGIRVWFARLQMPVLRVALAEPDFFGTLNHPARQLIDRMGSCVMGFDASAINGGALEMEIKRVVQVIEQYPETGKRVYELVYNEFQKFLAQFLTSSGATKKLVSVAQQVEQKETLTIQYTIEMRNMLKDMPVRDEIREFLFKVWAEVLAMAAVRKGPQHAETLELKKAATDLVWAASAKPSRSDRARVIQNLPKLVQQLRSGMTLLGVAPPAQEVHIKTVSDTLADAFLSKTQAIATDEIAAMAQRLERLEDFVGDDGSVDMPLDAQSIELILGIDASMIDVVADGGSQPNAAMRAWAQELEVGSWFTLDHNGRVAQVQFVWRSDRKHLNLFASSDGRSYLIQAARLAAYLQAGLLLPQEEETLTVRATRNALGKLEANPERLLG